GALQTLAGQDMNLKYAAGGDVLEHAVVLGAANIQLAGESGHQGRQVTANAIDISLAPDGATPTALVARDEVALTFPAGAGTPSRLIQSTTLDAKGQPGKGLTAAQFGGGVKYREQGGDTNRAVNADALDVALKPAMSGIELAKFAKTVRFEEGSMTAMGAA